MIMPPLLQPSLRVMRMGQYSLLFSPRTLCIQFGLLCLVLLCSLFALKLGSTTLSWQDLYALFRFSADSSTHLLVSFRLPRIIVALFSGAALGLSGQLLQSLTRNRLASPDWLGIPDGVTFSLLLVLILSPDGMLGPWWVGPLGALLSIVLLWLSAGKTGRQGQAILIIGMGLAALLRAGTELFLAQQSMNHASALYAWSLGSLQQHGAILPLVYGLSLLLPLVLFCKRTLTLLAFSPAQTQSLGVAIHKIQSFALILAMLLAGLAIAASGPLAFVALAAPIMAERLIAKGEIHLISSALLGGLFVLLADTAGRTLFVTIELPAGVICNILGGPFLLWLLLNSRQSYSK